MISKDFQDKYERAIEVERRMDDLYGRTGCHLLYWDSPFKLMIAVMMAAQTTDRAVNLVTPTLWEKYPTPEDLMMANVADVEHIISSIGLYHTKAERCIGCAEMLVNDFNGEMPQDVDELQKFPGVGRKTANIVMNEGFGKPVGIAVDTHVNRIAHMLGFVPRDLKDPNKVEQELLKLYPQEYWNRVNHQWVLFGREYCVARHPRCDYCPIADLCPSELNFY